MGKKVGLIFSIVFIFFLIVGSDSYAEEKKNSSELYKSELTIFFDEQGPKKDLNNKAQKPILIEGKSSSDRLPQLGEMVKNLIFLLVGLSLIIIILGIYFIKKLFKKRQQEVYE